MKYKIPCPTCGQSISMGRIMAAPTPFHLKCPKCKAKVRVKGWTLPGLIISLIIGGILGFGLSHLYFTKQIAGITAFAILIGAIIVLEIISSLLICSKGTLIVTKSHRDVA